MYYVLSLLCIILLSSLGLVFSLIFLQSSYMIPAPNPASQCQARTYYCKLFPFNMANHETLSSLSLLSLLFLFFFSLSLSLLSLLFSFFPLSSLSYFLPCILSLSCILHIATVQSPISSPQALWKCCFHLIGISPLILFLPLPN